HRRVYPPTASQAWRRFDSDRSWVGICHWPANGMKPRSLNTRLIVVVVSTIVLSWIAVVGVVFMQFSLNQTSTSDKELATIATQLLLTIPADSSFAERAGPGLQLRDPPDVDLELLVFQIW